MALPNPNKELVGQSQTQTLTLKDLLFYQKETEKWSENTDVNTYRAYVEEQKATKELAEKIESIYPDQISPNEALQLLYKLKEISDKN